MLEKIIKISEKTNLIIGIVSAVLTTLIAVATNIVEFKEN